MWLSAEISFSGMGRSSAANAWPRLVPRIADGQATPQTSRLRRGPTRGAIHAEHDDASGG